jgi:hypothetical protein
MSNSNEIGDAGLFLKIVRTSSCPALWTKLCLSDNLCGEVTMTFSKKLNRIASEPLNRERLARALNELERIHRNEVAAARHRGIVNAKLATTKTMRAMNAALKCVESPDYGRL